VVSNRVADLSASHQSGGLAVAMGEALQATGGLWCGWSGRISQEARWAGPSIRTFGKVRTATVDLTPAEEAGFYSGFSNGCLWPVLHQRLDLAQVRRQDEEHYFAVNDRMAVTLRRMLEPGDRVWVHDYHFMPLGEALRRHNVRQAIGFFLHTPFPPPETFRALPAHEALARALFAYDVVAFQTRHDRENFARYVEEALGGRRLDDERLSAFGQILRVHACPIGIDAARFTETARMNADAPEIAGLTRWLRGRRLIAGVDRLDYSKGLPERLRGFQTLLEHDPRVRGRVSLLQIAPPTRGGLQSYERVRRDVERLVGHVNGAYGDLGWVPVQYMHRPMPRALIAAVLRNARVGLVTPLNDGMNLVAKEYVAAQDAADPGVLVLSRFAGAAEQMQDAVLVNPHDPHDVADGLRRALAMRPAERRDRHAALWRRIATQDVAWWRERFLAALEDASGARIAATAPISAMGMAG
ncbi:MAG TPA: trehalose-6-phosphate synthase, partial [Afifellaceae bacterium]|nr:trehalose-6-phosphate synthase [Afifellaceae bacterium]